MEAEEQIREDGVVIHATPIVVRHSLQEGPVRVPGPGHRRVVFREFHPAAGKGRPGRAVDEVVVHLAAEVRRDPIQIRMDRCAMVALLLVLDEDVPIRVDVVRFVRGESKLWERERIELREESPEFVLKGGGLRIQIRPHETAPRFEPNPVQAALLLLEVHEGFRVRCSDKPTLRRIGPTVIRTDDGTKLRPRRFLHEARPPMAADVVEGPYDTVRATDHDDTLTANLTGEEIPRSSDLVLAAQVHPAAVVEFLELLPKDRLVGVERSRRRFRSKMLSDLATDVFRVATSHDSGQRTSQICALPLRAN